MRHQRLRHKLVGGCGWLLCGIALLLAGRVAADEAPASSETSDSVPSSGPRQALPAALAMQSGEIRNIAADQITRVAIGNPDVLDVSIVSSNEILLQGRAAGTTNLILWDQQGQHLSNVTITEKNPEAVESQLNTLIGEMNLAGVHVKRENGHVYIVGEVYRQEDLERLEQLLGGFPSVTNLVTLRTESASMGPGGNVPLVQLSVQVIDISKEDLDNIGVEWGDASLITQPEAKDLTVYEALTRWGTGVTRGSFQLSLHALVQQNRARILSEPKLATKSGKEASSFIGLEVPIITATSFGTTSSTVSASIEYRQTGVLLKMTPTVFGEGADQRITLVIQAEISGIDKSVALTVPVGAQTVQVPGFSVRKANTEVTTAPGETVMIAGLLAAEDTDNTKEVPGLGQMPVMGRLFRSPSIDLKQRELVIAVTPEIVSGADSKPSSSAGSGAGRSAGSASGLGSSTDVPLDEMSLGSAGREPEPLAEGGTIGGRVVPLLIDPAASPDDSRRQYAQHVHDLIAQVLRDSTGGASAVGQGTVKLRLHLYADGRLDQSVIAESSGNPSLDQAVLDASRAEDPYPPFPLQLQAQDLWLEFSVVFLS